MTRTEDLQVRLLGYRPTDRFWGWFWILLMTAAGGVLRFWSLGRPHQLVFDETYYVKQGVSMLDHGVEMRVKSSIPSPDVLFTQGTTDVFGTTGDMAVHPPVGKWVIAIGEGIFGATSSFGWRFSVALVGTLSILMVGRAARRMFGSTLLGAIAAYLMAFEGHHFVMSRTGILDIIVEFFVLAAFCALLIDRDAMRARLAHLVGDLPLGVWPSQGPWLGLRPWRWVAGIMLGLACGTKWSGVYFIAVFGLMTVWWDLGARRAAGVRHWVRTALLADGPLAALALIPTALVTYLLSWTGWFVTSDGYNRQWAQQNPDGGFGWLPDPLRSLWKYHTDVYAFAYNLTSPHSYESNPWGWMVQARPVSFFWESPTKGVDGCTVDTCAKAITSVGNIAIWWLATVGLAFLGYHWLLKRDWRAGAILAGYAAGWLPWFLYQHRTIFAFYAVAFEPWVILTCTFVLGLVLGPVGATARRRQRGVRIVGAYLVLVLVFFAFWWPIYTAQVIPLSHWQWRMWFPSWA